MSLPRLEWPRYNCVGAAGGNPALPTPMHPWGNSYTVEVRMNWPNKKLLLKPRSSLDYQNPPYETCFQSMKWQLLQSRSFCCQGDSRSRTYTPPYSWPERSKNTHKKALSFPTGRLLKTQNHPLIRSIITLMTSQLLHFLISSPKELKLTLKYILCTHLVHKPQFCAACPRKKKEMVKAAKEAMSSCTRKRSSTSVHTALNSWPLIKGSSQELLFHVN